MKSIRVLIIIVLIGVSVVACGGPTGTSTGTTTGASTGTTTGTTTGTPLSAEKTLTVFNIVTPAATGVITGTNIDVTVPFGTSLTALVAAYTTTGKSVTVGSAVQISGTTTNDFTSPVVYTVIAEDATTQKYLVSVTVASATAKDITAFSFASPAAIGVITGTNIAVTVPYGTGVTALVASFATSGASVKVGGTVQTSGATENDFTSPVTYTVTAGDTTTKTYRVTVTVGLNPAKAITSFSMEAGAVWAPRETARDWTAVASSSDGTKLVAFAFSDDVYTSTDSGMNWTARDMGLDWTGVASSSDGTKLAGVSQWSPVFTSTDSGVNWTACTIPVCDWTGIASSSDGTKLVAVPKAQTIFTSSDSGVNWSNHESMRDWSAVASSSDGTKLVATVNPGYIYTSTDSGANWTPRESVRNWSAVASSSDGTKLVATVYGGPIYTSTNSGVTWNQSTMWPGNWSAVASSSDGTKLIAVVSWGYIYTSTDSGANWIGRGSFRYWSAVASSSNGTKLVALEKEGQIYTSSAVSGTITEGAHTIAVSLPTGTAKTALVFKFATTGTTVKIGSTVQVSGVTTNNFTSPLTYTVTAADGTMQDYVVTVTAP